jgi:hypothetical protein
MPAPPKPPRGTYLLERKERRKQLDAAEDAHKADVRRRDVYQCRYPDCPFCRRYKDLPLEVAHVCGAKGMSGDRTLARSTPDKLMLLCKPIHGLQEQHLIDVRPLTAEGTNGPCGFWRRQTQDEPFYLVAEETAIRVYRRD